jgi:hypothetical protein
MNKRIRHKGVTYEYYHIPKDGRWHPWHKAHISKMGIKVEAFTVAALRCELKKAIDEKLAEQEGNK